MPWLAALVGGGAAAGAGAAGAGAAGGAAAAAPAAIGTGVGLGAGGATASLGPTLTATGAHLPGLGAGIPAGATGGASAALPGASVNLMNATGGAFQASPRVLNPTSAPAQALAPGPTALRSSPGIPQDTGLGNAMNGFQIDRGGPQPALDTQGHGPLTAGKQGIEAFKNSVSKKLGLKSGQELNVENIMDAQMENLLSDDDKQAPAQVAAPDQSKPAVFGQMIQSGAGLAAVQRMTDSAVDRIRKAKQQQLRAKSTRA